MAIKDGTAPRKSKKIRVPKTIVLSKLLLGKDNYNKSHTKKDSINWTSQIFGEHFQRKLRVYKHKNEAGVYACPRCNSGDTQADKGIIASVQGKFEAELSRLALYEVTNSANNMLVKAGLASKSQLTTGQKGQSLSAATGIFNEYLKHNKKMRAVIRAHSKKLKEYSTKLLIDPEAVGKYTAEFINNANTVYKGMFSTCPVCLGNGYLDIGHKDIVGKQVEILQILYNKYIAGRENPNWERRINVNDLYEEIFVHLAVGPEIPKQMDKDAISSTEVVRQLRTLKVNRLDAYTKQAADAIRRTQNYMYELYKGNTNADLGTGVTYEQVIEFFGLLTKPGKVRVKTGTMRDKLLEQKSEYTKALSKLGNYSHTFPSKYLIVEGATAAERSNKLTKSSSLYVYAAKYENIWYKGNNRTVQGLANQVFGNADLKITFFPQRYKNYE